jgi:O-antigen/teichoic acid export membrane protein
VRVSLGRLRPGATSWAFADQLLWSGSNFLTTLLLARILAPDDFGTYVLAYSAWTIILIAAREGLAQPFILLCAHMPLEEIRRRASDGTGVVLCVGGVSGLIVCGVGAVIGTGSPAGRLYLVLGAFVPLLLLQDHCRYLAFTAKKAQIAVVSDVVWTVLQLTALAALYAVDRTSTVTVVFAWAGAGACASLVALWLLRVRPRVGRRTPSQLREMLALGRWMVLSGAMAQLLAFLQLGLLALLYDESVVGAVRAIQVLFVPLALLSTAMSTALLPELAASANHGDAERLRQRVRVYNIGLVGMTAVYVVPFLAWGEPILRLLLDARFADYSFLLPPLVAFTLVSAANTAPEAALKAMRQMRNLAAIIGIVGAARLLLTFGVGSVASVTAVMWAMTGVVACWTAWLWWLYVRHWNSLAMRRAPTSRPSTDAVLPA